MPEDPALPVKWLNHIMRPLKLPLKWTTLVLLARRLHKKWAVHLSRIKKTEEKTSDIFFLYPAGSYLKTLASFLFVS
jgi:hypothetical protein